jgi:hypothetical protein
MRTPQVASKGSRQSIVVRKSPTQDGGAHILPGSNAEPPYAPPTRFVWKRGGSSKLDADRIFLHAVRDYASGSSLNPIFISTARFTCSSFLFSLRPVLLQPLIVQHESVFQPNSPFFPPPPNWDRLVIFKIKKKKNAACLLACLLFQQNQLFQPLRLADNRISSISSISSLPRVTIFLNKREH